MTDQILNIVAEHFKIPVSDICFRCRKERYIKPRFIACFLLRKWEGLSYSQIAEIVYPYLHVDAKRSCAIKAERQVLNSLETETWIYEDVKILDEKCAEIFQLKKAS